MNRLTLVHVRTLAGRCFDRDVAPRLVGLQAGAAARLRRRYVSDVVRAVRQAGPLSPAGTAHRAARGDRPTALTARSGLGLHEPHRPTTS